MSMAHTFPLPLCSSHIYLVTYQNKSDDPIKCLYRNGGLWPGPRGPFSFASLFFFLFFFLSVTLATHRSLIFLHSILLRAWVVVMKINALHFNTFATIPSFFDLCASGPV